MGGFGRAWTYGPAVLLGVVVTLIMTTITHRLRTPCEDMGATGVLLSTYRRQLEEMQVGLNRVKRQRRGDDGQQEAQRQEEIRTLMGQLVAATQQIEALKQANAEAAVGSHQALSEAERKAYEAQAIAEIPHRMSPTLERQALPSDAQDWSKRPKRAPTFQELYLQVENKEFDEQDNVIMKFVNPYNKQAHMTYPHSSMWLEGDKVMERVVQELAANGQQLKFIVEAGSMHGGSAIRMAMELDKRGLTDIPILCIDPWTGDLNMWLNRIVWEHLDVRDGRATTFDQFVLNVRQAITEGKISNHHIVPFPVSSIVGARWLQATGFRPNLVYLDSAHELDETYYELCLYWDIVEPGGILMGDDYGWLAVRMDVDRFVKDYKLELNMFGVFYNWFVRKPKV